MRKDAREITFKLIFQHLFTTEEGTSKAQLISSPEYEVLEDDENYINEVLYGVKVKQEELEEDVKAHAVGYPIERIYKTDLAILLLATYEIKYVGDVPYKVSVSEAVNLAKKFGSEKSGSYINGILASIVKNVEQA